MLEETRSPLAAALALLALAACVGPGFQAEVLYEELRPSELRLHTSVPAEAQELGSVESRRAGARLAMGGPDWSARGYFQAYGERLELPGAAGGSDFDVLGVGLGALGRQRLDDAEPDELGWILPYRAGLNWGRGDGSGQATPTGRFGDLEYYEWVADLGFGVSFHRVDLVVGGTIRRFDGHADLREEGGAVHVDGLRGTNAGPYVSLSYSLTDLPWRFEARAGFGDLEGARFTAGLSY